MVNIYETLVLMDFLNFNKQIITLLVYYYIGWMLLNIFDFISIPANILWNLGLIGKINKNT